MYLDFEDHRPDVPRVPSAISRREGVLLSLVAHGLFLLGIVFLPGYLPDSTAAELSPEERAPREQLRFVEVVPSREFFDAPQRPAVQSDADRRSMTREQAPNPENEMAYSRGNTPEPIVGGPRMEPSGGSPPEPESAESQPDAQLEAPMRDDATFLPVPREEPSTVARANGPGQALRDLARYLREDNFNNDRGGQTDFGSDIQFDSKGVDFGPWLRRFKNQIENNWLVPQAAGLLKGRVVVQFFVLRSGAIVDLRVVEPSSVPAFTIAAVNALKLSNPTAALPPEYPDDRALFTVTFHYN